jgi:predicted transcriptional regulator
MTHRTSFALDAGTVQRLKRLASRWSVSQAEVVRRSVEHAEKQSEPGKPHPVALLKAFHAKGGLSTARAEKWIAEIHQDRKRWRAK